MLAVPRPVASGNAVCQWSVPWWPIVAPMPARMPVLALWIIRLPEQRLDLKAFCALPGPKVSLEKLKAAVEAEREED